MLKHQTRKGRHGRPSSNTATTSPVARELAPAGPRSDPKTWNRGYSDRTHPLILRLLCSRAGASSLATKAHPDGTSQLSNQRLSRRFLSAFLWCVIKRRFLLTWRSVSVFLLPSYGFSPPLNSMRNAQTPDTKKGAMGALLLIQPPSNLWRGSLLPLGREATPKPGTEGIQIERIR